MYHLQSGGPLVYIDKILGLHRISALANPKSCHFFPNPAPAKFLAGFGWIWQTPEQLQCVQLNTGKN